MPYNTESRMFFYPLSPEEKPWFLFRTECRANIRMLRGRGEQFMTVRQHGVNLMIISRGKSSQHDSYRSSATGD
jgi:hypothetical protein